MPEIRVEPLIPQFESSTDTLGGPSQAEFTIYHLWGPWSDECRRGFKEFAALFQKYESNPRVRIVSIAFPQSVLVPDDLRQQVQTFYDEAKVFVPTSYDADGKTSLEIALLMPHGSLGFPTTIVVDKDHRVVQVIEGFESGKLAGLEALVGE